MRDGVNVFGFVRAELGIGEAARLLVATVKAAGSPYAVVPIEKFVPSRQDHPFDDLGAGRPVYDVNVVVLNPPELLGFANEGGAELLARGYTIGNWWWEVNEYPASMRVATHLVDEVWVGSTHAADAIAPVVPQPVLTFRLPVVRPRTAPLDRRALGLPDAGFLFLFTFDFHSIFERKNPVALVDAFKRAFRPGEGPHLVVKSINGTNRPKQLLRLRDAAEGRPDIHVIDGYLAAEVQHGLIRACDVYVSLHRAEGFGLTMAEAMAFGKPVIATGYSGNLEFMHAGNSFLVPYELTTIPEGCDPYPAGGEWAEPDVEAAAATMRRVYDDPAAARGVGERARVEIEERHGVDARARFLQTRLETIRQTRRAGIAVARPAAPSAPRPRRLRTATIRTLRAVWTRLPERGRAALRPTLSALRLRGQARATRRA